MVNSMFYVYNLAMSNLIDTIRKKIRIARGNLTQKELSSQINISQNTLSQWESGKRDINIDVIPRIAKITNKPLSWFFESETCQMEEEYGEKNYRKPLSRDYDLNGLTKKINNLAESNEEIRELLGVLVERTQLLEILLKKLINEDSDRADMIDSLIKNCLDGNESLAGRSKSRRH